MKIGSFQCSIASLSVTMIAACSSGFVSAPAAGAAASWARLVDVAAKTTRENKATSRPTRNLEEENHRTMERSFSPASGEKLWRRLSRRAWVVSHAEDGRGDPVA